MMLQVLVTYGGSGTYVWDAMDTGSNIATGTSTTLTAAGAAAKTAIITYATGVAGSYTSAGQNIQ